MTESAPELMAVDLHVFGKGPNQNTEFANFGNLLMKLILDL